MHTVLSFDVDRTLVDRSRYSHYVVPRVKDALLEAVGSKSVIVLLNTGRDLGALKEFDYEVGMPLDAFFLSGRGERVNEHVSVKAEAILSPELVSHLFERAAELEIPFLDIKTGSGVLQIVFQQSSLPFGLQKPRDWYRHYSPTVLLASDLQTINTVNNLKPLRIEIPFRYDRHGRISDALSLPAEVSTETSPVHRDYLDGNYAGIENWAILQLLSPIEQSNKGTSLRDYVKQLERDVRVVHFGDSETNHNSDTVVATVLPQSEYVEVRWGSSSNYEVEKLLVNSIRKYL